MKTVFVHHLTLEAQRFGIAMAINDADVHIDKDALSRTIRIMARHTIYGLQKQHSVPVTWWDHLKLALNRRWPRLRLAVRFVPIDVRALFPEVQAPPLRDKFYIAYTSEPSSLELK